MDTEALVGSLISWLLGVYSGYKINNQYTVSSSFCLVSELHSGQLRFFSFLREYLESRVDGYNFIIHVLDSIYVYSNRNHGQSKKIRSLSVNFLIFKINSHFSTLS